MQLIALCAAWLACEPDKPPETPKKSLSALGMEGEPCAVGLRTVRACAAGLECTEMWVAPPDPNDKRIISQVGGGCGGRAELPCAQGLVCHIDENDPLAKDGMGVCQTQSVCRPPLPPGQ